MSSPELHDLAMRRALHHADFGFLWQLLRELPAAEAAEGNPGRTGADMYRISALISDALGSGEGETAEALRRHPAAGCFRHPARFRHAACAAGDELGQASGADLQGRIETVADPVLGGQAL